MRVTMDVPDFFLQMTGTRWQNPGSEAQGLMMPSSDSERMPLSLNLSNCSEASVLLLVYPKHQDWYLVLTKRSGHLTAHQGQISLPGGRREPEEAAYRAALRETAEELGIATSKIGYIRELSPLFLSRSNFCISPFVAIMTRTPRFKANRNEVESVIELPLDHLLDDRNIQQEIRSLRGMEMNVPYFHFNGFKIWGATAMILSEFRVLINRIQEG